MSAYLYPTLKSKKGQAKKWMGSTPQCDFCKKTGEALQQFVDGKTKMGPWAMMCPTCFRKHGVGIGQGMGQEYHRHADGTYPKIAG